MIRALLILFFIASQYTYAQRIITGVVVDASDKKAMSNASIVILNQDSILQSFARTTEDGRFKLSNLKSGKYLLMITYPKFEVFSQELELFQTDLKLDSIKINSQANLLEEIIVTQRIPIKLKGDTIEYDAGSFETEKNAKLEDLLRRLPGLTVSNTGEITAQGKTVSKVLIDGEEFFGYDPKIAIRNVRADAVDKVQVYERKSEQAELTGVDDGVRLQTVNVLLKDEAKKGIFGNANANLGTKKLYDANLFSALFNKSERIGFTGSLNNMGNFGDASMIRMNNQITGSPKHQSAGVNYENNLFQKKLHLTSSYSISNNGNSNETESYNKQVIDKDNSQETSRNSATSNNNFNNVLRSNMRLKIDSVSNLRLQINAGKGNANSSSASNSKTTRNEGLMANEFESDNNSKSDSENMDVRLDYRRSLGKTGRSINLHVNTQLNNKSSTDYVDELTHFYDSLGVANRVVNVDQTRLTETKSNNFSTSLNFTEPITEKINLTLGYNFNTSNSTGLVDAYNNARGGQLDTLYSKNEQDKYNNNGMDIGLNFRFTKFNVNLTNTTTYKQQDLADSYRDINLSRSFWQNNFNANMQYMISKTKIFTLGYQNNTNVPSFAQLQPLQPPTNELYVQLGNPDLKREIRNAINMNFSKFSILKASSLNINGSTSFTSNAIVNNSILDTTGKTTTTYVNISDKTNWNANLYASYGRPIFNGVLQFSPFITTSYNNNYIYINGVLNQNNNSNASLGINSSKQNSKALDFNISLSLGMNNEKNSVQTQLNNTSLRTNFNTDLKYHLPYKFSLTQVIYYGFTGKTKAFPEPIHQFYMNLELNRKLLESESLLLSLKAFDVFNSYNNTQRSFSNSNYSESRQQLLSQYFMVGLKWDFNKNLGKKND